MRRLLLATAASLAFAGAASAQVNVVPQIGVETAILKQATYSAVSIGLVPASAATDIFCIGASATKDVSVKQIEISGVAGTLTTVPFTLLRRATLDTGGTAALTTAAPNLTVGANISTDVATTAVLIAYTANPTITDASPTYYRTAYNNLPTVAAGTGITTIQWQAGEFIGTFSKALNLLKGSTQQYCINLNGATVSSGLLDIDITWIEQ